MSNYSVDDFLGYNSILVHYNYVAIEICRLKILTLIIINNNTESIFRTKNIHAKNYFKTRFSVVKLLYMFIIVVAVHVFF